MGAFPFDIHPDGDKYRWDPIRFEERLQAADGSSQINATHPLTQREFNYESTFLTRTDKRRILEHFDTDSAQSFSLFDYWYLEWNALSVGTGNGIQTTFDLLGREFGSTGTVLKEAGVAKPGTLFLGTGNEGRDQFTFNVAPANGAAITLDCTSGRRVFQVIYLVPRLQPFLIQADLFGIRIPFLEKVP